MTGMEIWENLTAEGAAGWIVGIVVILMSVIEIAPVKFNPWDSFLGWVGKKMNRRMEDRLDSLQKQVTDMWVNAHRQSILTFAREARSGVQHSNDEWGNVLTVAAEYEAYCEKEDLANGIVKADTEYIRNLYQELSRDHRI